MCICSIFVLMDHLDYIIVGCGLAGIAFCEQLREHKKTFVVFEDSSQQASSVAVGLYNPVVLKRFTTVWKAEETLDLATEKYAALEKLLDITINYKIPVYRKFASIEEQNQWFSAMDKPVLDRFLSSQIVQSSNPNIKAPYNFGRVLETGRIDTVKLIKTYRKFLKENNLLFHEPFDYDSLKLNIGHIEYKNIKSKCVVFTEGFGMSKNPYFKNLSLNPVKGEIITIKAPELNLDVIIKSSVFIVPMGNHLYAVGATYNWTDKTKNPTNEGKEELLRKLKSVIDCDFEVVGHVAGLRPTVLDRRPLVGVHPKYKNLFVLNGLGTRGVMNAPYVAEQLFNLIENGIPLDKEIDINRFKNKLN